MFTIFVFCLIGIAVAQRPVPCTTPPQWEARVFDVNEQREFELEGRLSYDAVYRRERIAEELDVGTEQDFYDILSLFDSKIEFAYNYKTRTCARREITRPWRDFGINANDTSYGEAYIGSSAFPGSGVLVTIWGGNYTSPMNETRQFMSTWTYQGCIPVSRTNYGGTTGITHISFYDVTAGISDPNVFIPRRACLSDEEWANRYTLFGAPTNKYI